MTTSEESLDKKWKVILEFDVDEVDENTASRAERVKEFLAERDLPVRGGLATPELADIFKRDTIACQMKKRIEEHRSMTC